MVDIKELNQSNILIVDDKVANINLLVDILEREGYENYISATDPRVVPKLCLLEKFDLILLDIIMPHMNGIQVMNALAEQVKDDYVPILVLTARTDPKTRKQALQAGAKDFLSKPFNDWEVALHIKNMLETRYFYKRQVLRTHTLEQEVRDRTREVRDSQLEIVRRLSRAGEYRDSDTGEHIVRMSRIAEILAKGLGLDKNACEMVLNACPMHDIGKIAIPDSILLKNGPLASEEWEIMKTHCQAGSKILGGHHSEIIWTASQVAMCHHEKWDGTGYPNGLKGADIPLVARIAAVADVFDALTSVRPYKKAWPVEKAVDLIRRESGRHFDPEIVEVFLGHLPEIVAVKQEHPDTVAD